MGRFIQPDTIIARPYDPQDLNRYSYCRNNPINYVDPTGHSWWSHFWKALVGGLVAGLIIGLSGGTAAPFIAIVAAGMAGGAITGGLEGGLNGAIQGALIGGAGGIIGGIIAPLGGAAIAAYGAVMVAGGAIQTAMSGGSLSDYSASLAGGLIGGAVGYSAGQRISQGLASPKQTLGNVQQNTKDVEAKARIVLEVDNKPAVSPSEYSGLELTTNRGVEGQSTWNLLDPRIGAKAYRVFDNKLNGSSWTPIDPRTVPDYANAAGLYNKGGFLAEGTIVDPSGIITRPALPGPTGKGGGLAEWVIPNSKTQVKINNIHIYGLNTKNE